MLAVCLRPFQSRQPVTGEAEQERTNKWSIWSLVCPSWNNHVKNRRSGCSRWVLETLTLFTFAKCACWSTLVQLRPKPNLPRMFRIAMTAESGLAFQAPASASTSSENAQGGIHKLSPSRPNLSRLLLGHRSLWHRHALNSGIPKARWDSHPRKQCILSSPIQRKW